MNKLSQNTVKQIAQNIALDQVFIERPAGGMQAVLSFADSKSFDGDIETCALYEDYTPSQVIEELEQIVFNVQQNMKSVTCGF